MENLSANQRWKKSGTTLPFKEWINRENEKAKANADVESNFIPYNESTQFSTFDSNNSKITQLNDVDVVENTFIPYNEYNESKQFSKITQFNLNGNSNDSTQLIDDTIKSTYNSNIYKPTQENKNQVLGLDKKVFVFSSLLILGSLGFYFYKKLKEKK